MEPAWLKGVPAGELAGASWAQHGPAFEGLVELRASAVERVVAMRLATDGGRDLSTWSRLAELWLELPQHPALLEAITREDTLLVRYAAIDWRRRPVSLDQPGAAARVASYGVALTRALELVAACVPASERGWMACPFVELDLNELPRIGFASPAGSAAHVQRVAPEVISNWPACDERGLVFAAGQLLLQLARLERPSLTTPLGQVIRRCLFTHPERRFPTLVALREALVAVGGQRKVRELGAGALAWEAFEAGLGFLWLGQPTSALVKFERALALAPTSRFVRAGVARAIAEGGQPDPILTEHRDRRNIPYVPRRYLILEGDPSQLVARFCSPWPRVPAEKYVPPPLRRTLPWRTRELAARLEADQDPGGALAIYQTVQITEASQQRAIDLDLARCYLAVGDVGRAIDHARRVLAVDPRSTEAHELFTRALLRRRLAREALAAAAAWEAVAGDHARLHYLRGKALFLLGRVLDARAAFDRASVLAPRMLEALLLRTEMDRAIRRLHVEVGAQVTPLPSLPAPLEPLREALVAGRTGEVIDVLAAPAHAGDVIAQLLRAELLVSDARWPEAHDVLVPLVDDPAHGNVARIALARVLLQLGRVDEARATIELARTARPQDPEVHEVRAAVLDRLGQADGAEQARRQALALGIGRSDARVRHHPRP